MRTKCTCGWRSIEYGYEDEAALAFYDHLQKQYERRNPDREFPLTFFDKPLGLKDAITSFGAWWHRLDHPGPPSEEGYDSKT